ncbi:transcriptional regulator [Nocardioides marmotae]|uniref:transcriptional regulator n=1 Tax=Nocardioides marmotae TaxID=2663857 RepID=UPI0012B5DD3F|nr:transcriptional regulator [Nocardioides marmotae]MBC9732047.1 transcriptional regulator [Nocardioides marmotae]MTB83168.1 transcriptional regulator [Nocardioides marmotae]
MAHVRPLATVESALRASDAGVPDRENAAAHGVAVKTIRRWRREYQRRGRPRGQTHLAPPCPRCEDGPLDEPAYAELLGWYLGDGHISLGRRGVHALHVYDDARYVADIARIQELMRAVKPGGRPHTRQVPGAVVVTVSWKHWPCLLPQHGPGRKHERPIVLEPWQREIVAAHPGPFLRGLFHSDGSRVRNWATRTVAGATKRYDYPRWQFSNRSEDIHGLCTWALDLAGIPWRRSGRWTTSVSRRDAVAALDRLIGPKS